MAAVAAPDRAHHRRRFSGRDPDEAHRAATPLELLFDLTFVVAFGIAANELAHYLADGHVWPGILGFVFATFAVSWAWINYSWFASAYDTDDWVFRLATMVQMVGVIVLALGLAAGVRVDRARRRARQPRHGRRLRRHARADGVPVGAGGAGRSAAAAGGARLHLDDLGRAGVLGRARDRRPADRGDVRDRARADRDRDVGPVHRRAPQGRHAVARAPHRGALRPARDHHARRGDHRHGRLDQRRRARLRRAGRSTPPSSRSRASGSRSRPGGRTSRSRGRTCSSCTASGRSSGATATWSSSGRSPRWAPASTSPPTSSSTRRRSATRARCCAR